MGRIVKGFGRVVPKVVLDARGEAESLIRAAQTEAVQIRAGAEAARAEAQRDGLEEGRAEGFAGVVATLAAARADAARARETAAPAAVTLAVKMAEKIVGRAVDLDSKVMSEITGAALEACRPRGGALRLRVHPDDLPGVAARRDLLAARAPAATALELVADAAVGRYGCVLETPHGRVDARLETQLAALERALDPAGGGPRG